MADVSTTIVASRETGDLVVTLVVMATPLDWC